MKYIKLITVIITTKPIIKNCGFISKLLNFAFMSLLIFFLLLLFSKLFALLVFLLFLPNSNFFIMLHLLVFLVYLLISSWCNCKKLLYNLHNLVVVKTLFLKEFLNNKQNRLYLALHFFLNIVLLYIACFSRQIE